MADNVPITAGTGTDIATDDVGGAHFQRIKLDVGGDGSSTPVTAAAPLPVVQTGTPGLPTGASTLAEQQSQTTALQIIDDWDESDRAKANIIVGQAGVAAGAGAVGATVQRMTLASDDPAVAALQILDNAISGSEMQVDVVAALPAGTNAIGKLAANSGVDIGDVDVTSLPAIPAGTNNIGDVDVLTLPVVNPVLRISQTPTVSTSPAYTAKDAVGGLLTFANAARVSGGGGVIQSVTVVDKSQQRPNLELVLFDQTFTASTDNAVFDPSDADLANVLGVVAVNSWSDFNDNSVATVSGVNLPFDLTGTDLFGQLLTRSTPTFVGTSDIIVIVQVVQA